MQTFSSLLKSKLITSSCLLTVFFLGSVFLAGCNGSSSMVEPALIKAAQEKLLLDEEPTGAIEILKLREELASQDTKEPKQVVVIGKIGGIAKPWKETAASYPWVPGEASVYLSDTDVSEEIERHAAAHGSNHADCAFCAKQTYGHAIVVVRFLDEANKPIEIPAKELFNGGETIVVQGTATATGPKDKAIITIDVTKVYIRK